MLWLRLQIYPAADKYLTLCLVLEQTKSAFEISNHHHVLTAAKTGENILGRADQKEGRYWLPVGEADVD